MMRLSQMSSSGMVAATEQSAGARARRWCMAASFASAFVNMASANDGGQPERDPVSSATSAVIQEYCTNIRDAAAEARIAHQMKQLGEMERHVEDRIAKLEAERSEFEEWLQRREQLLVQAEAKLVSVYAGMRPDAAAMQLAVLDSEMAASILSSLRPRIASAILNEMEPQRAADLVLAISGPVETAEAASE